MANIQCFQILSGMYADTRKGDNSLYMIRGYQGWGKDIHSSLYSDENYNP
ncbi:MAG: hypothetical protein ACRCST_12665 [Turicibacter sp.]